MFIKTNTALVIKEISNFYPAMIKWFAYIVALLIFAPNTSSGINKNDCFYNISNNLLIIISNKEPLADTTATKNVKKISQDDKVKIKEVTKTKKQPKPEKVVPADNTTASQTKQRHKRERRPEGLERPPEIPRRNGN